MPVLFCLRDPNNHIQLILSLRLQRFLFRKFKKILKLRNKNL